MSGDSTKGEERAEAETPAPAPAARKRYSSPALIRYGTLAEVTGNKTTGSVSDAMGMLAFRMM
jgi:hypothetical protein